MADDNTIDDLHSRLNRETARIAWSELQRFFASGMVLRVNDSLDLVDVAAKVAEDDSIAVAAWLEGGQLGPVPDDLATRWLEENPQVWAVVVAPWVLVQRSKAVAKKG